MAKNGKKKNGREKQDTAPKSNKSKAPKQDPLPPEPPLPPAPAVAQDEPSDEVEFRQGMTMQLEPEAAVEPAKPKGPPPAQKRKRIAELKEILADCEQAHVDVADEHARLNARVDELRRARHKLDEEEREIHRERREAQRKFNERIARKAPALNELNQLQAPPKPAAA